MTTFLVILSYLLCMWLGAFLITIYSDRQFLQECFYTESDRSSFQEVREKQRKEQIDTIFTTLSYNDLSLGKEIQALWLLGHLGADVDIDHKKLTVESDYKAKEEWIEAAQNWIEKNCPKRVSDSLIKYELPRDKEVLLNCLGHLFLDENYDLRERNQDICDLIYGLGGKIHYIEDKGIQIEFDPKFQAKNSELDHAWDFVKEMMRKEAKESYNLGNWESKIL